jgi:hypothetical protein
MGRAFGIVALILGVFGLAIGAVVLDNLRLSVS